MSRRGFTLLELNLAAVLLILGLVVCFSLFEWGSRSFILSNIRSGLQGEARRAQLALLADLRRSDMAGMEVIDSAVQPTRRVSAGDGTMVERDAYSILALGAWDQPTSFDSITSQPLWNRYQVVYATTVNPGLLVKQFYTPASPPYTTPMTNLGACLKDDPTLNPNSLRPNILCQSVHAFRVTRDTDLHTVALSLTLSSIGLRKGEGRAINERFEVTFGTRLENSGQ